MKIYSTIFLFFFHITAGLIADGSREDSNLSNPTPKSNRKSSSSGQEDPLKNTKKLVVEGHKSLYQNGAFPVGSTSLKFIPPGNEAEIFIQGRRFSFAKASFQENLKRASESVVVLKEGYGLTYRLANETSRSSIQLSKELRDSMILPGVYVMGKAQADSLGIAGRSWDRGLEFYRKTQEEASSMAKILYGTGLSLEEERKIQKELRNKDREIAKQKEEARKRQAREFLKARIQKETNSFVLGYTNIPGRFRDRSVEVVERLGDLETKEEYREVEQKRQENSSDFLDELSDLWIGIGERMQTGFRKAGNELDGIESGAGLSWALLKSVAITAKTLFVEGIVRPIGGTTIHSIGYVVSNTVVYPIGLITISGKTVAVVLVEVIDYGADGVIGIVAPSGRLALAGMIGGATVLSEGIADISRKSIQSGSEVGRDLGSRAGSAGLKGAGLVTEKSGTYLVAPVAFGLGTVGETIKGIGSYSLQTLGGAGMATTGSAVSVVGLGAGQTVAGAIYVGGTTVSAGTAGGFGVYYVSKAFAIPSGVYVGSGVVMSYEMVAQLSAHTILAASDVSYLVLSLEGGRWILYGVKQTGKTAKYVMTGSMVDLDEIRKEGGEVYEIPVGEEEMERVLRHVDESSENHSE